ncbi:formylglycine-generating enzyme family protein [Chondromyces apiculatus]|uniref:Protein kinase domain protein n=1 Tax=Chondromyces apiculatus DSM 436 TaxID=1192034 RepID=A0A017T2L6_9BACT|nr:SUMF1/EgtB/PvdO family nonheme iron enzyme [Chondromyces apiculatus]EYF03478.1 protein kinase domain protein [Chondromyces apiculatus DSM 436]
MGRTLAGLALDTTLATTLALTPAACTRGGGPSGDPDAAPPWDVAVPDPEPRPGMAWIPGGVLLAGTAPDRIPRIADEEMAGEQVVMQGFYMDLYPYPNEVGAIPTTAVSLAEGRALCEAQGKRLCSELELERACKGPSNTVYEYGDAYKSALCGTGQAKSLIPNGYNGACVSGFGVYDLHGGVWTWTSSAWQRGNAKPGLVTQRGGNGLAGDLIGRCAHGRGMRPEAKRADTGVRCCAGEPNTFEVVLAVTRGQPLRLNTPLDEKLAGQLAALATPEALATSGSPGVPATEVPFAVERIWVWHPLGNEEILLGGGCAHPPGQKGRCGIVAARMRFDRPVLLSFVPSDWWTPTLGEADSARELYLYGGDHEGAFRRRVSYEWGRLGLADKERKRKRKGTREPTFD